MQFAVDGWEVWTISIVYCLLLMQLWKWKKRQPSPYLCFSRAEQLTEVSLNISPLYLHLPTYCKWTALIFLIIAALNPRLLIDQSYSIDEKKQMTMHSLPVEGAALYLVLDHSSSMKDTVFSTVSAGKEVSLSKMELLKDVTKNFINGDASIGLQGRHDDLIGLVTFSRTAQILSPLTFDHNLLLHMLSKIDVVEKEDVDGTALGYAIFKTANMIVTTRDFMKGNQENPSHYTITSAAIILVTDGFQYPNPLDQGNRWRNMDIEEAAQYAKDNNIKLYVVNIDPAIADHRFTPIREQMQHSAELTGGQYYILNDHNDLNQIYAAIDQLEKNKYSAKEQVQAAQQQVFSILYFFPFLITLSLILLTIGFSIETVVWRQVP